MDTNLEITKTNSDCAQYTGTVTIATYLGDRLIQIETHHNSGLKTLFEFISSCLQGNYSEAKSKRPCKLVLLRADEDEPEDSKPTDPNAINSKGEHYWSPTYEVCSPIMYDSAAVATTSSTSSSVKYHFRVPFLKLTSGSKVKKLMLLPSTATDYTKDACAYYVLNDPIQVPDTAANYTIIIDWTLEFTNTSSKDEAKN